MGRANAEGNSDARSCLLDEESTPPFGVYARLHSHVRRSAAGRRKPESASATARVYSRAVRRRLVFFAGCVQADGPFRPDQVDSARQSCVLVSYPRRRAARTLSRRTQSRIRRAFPSPQYGFLSPNVSVRRPPPGTAFPNVRRIGEWSNRGNYEKEVYVRAEFF